MLRYLTIGLLALLTVSVMGNDKRPVIGIWAQPINNASREYVAASYVKWVESAGGRAVPVPYNSLSDSSLDELFKSVNGILFPGGSAALPPSAVQMYKKAVAANRNGDHFPIWGTCLGFQWLLMAQAGEQVLSTGYKTENISLPLNLTSAAPSSRLLNLVGDARYGAELRKILTDPENPVTMNNHHNGVTPDAYTATRALNTFFSVLSTNIDPITGREFLSTVEAKDPTMPIYGVQWHPEKNQFEWGSSVTDRSIPYEAINHSPAAIKASSAMADFFLSEARRNNHSYADPNAEWDAMIWHLPLENNQCGGFSQVYTMRS